ncbi:MAG: hypothetical protein NZ843_04515, partial [Fimbriimonadales bacterium]|nr:hypothetical protein [Fimbriimonadales bacterium]
TPKPSCITAQLPPIEPAPQPHDHAYNWDADRLQIRKVMQKKVGIVRTVQRLHEARCELEQLAPQIEAAYRMLPPSVESCEARNLIACALLITHSALARQESRGLHYVLDYPEPRAEYAACPTLIMP